MRSRRVEASRLIGSPRIKYPSAPAGRPTARRSRFSGMRRVSRIYSSRRRGVPVRLTDFAVDPAPAPVRHRTSRVGDAGPDPVRVGTVNCGPCPPSAPKPIRAAGLEDAANFGHWPNDREADRVWRRGQIWVAAIERDRCSARSRCCRTGRTASPIAFSPDDKSRRLRWRACVGWTAWICRSTGAGFDNSVV